MATSFRICLNQGLGRWKGFNPSSYFRPVNWDKIWKANPGMTPSSCYLTVTIYEIKAERVREPPKLREEILTFHAQALGHRKTSKGGAFARNVSVSSLKFSSISRFFWFFIRCSTPPKQYSTFTSLWDVFVSFGWHFSSAYRKPARNFYRFAKRTRKCIISIQVMLKKK